jgi:hypothetical protein
MVSLEHPATARTLELPPRTAIDAGTADVLVVGGSLAGVGAAIAAAREGARVILTERCGFFGGDATASLVTILMSCYTQHPRRPEPGTFTLFPCDYGDGKPAVGGIYAEMVDRLARAGGAIAPSPDTGYTFPTDPEVFKFVLQDMVEEAGIQVLLHATAVDTLGRGTIDRVIFETKSGPVALGGKVVVDCTGDGDVAARAGAPFAVGRDSDGFAQPITLYFIMGDFDRDRFAAYVHQHPDQWHDVYGLWDLVEQARRAGDMDLQRENILMFGTPRSDEIVVDSTRVVKVPGINAWDLTRAALENRRQMREIANFLTKYVPGFERSYITQSGPTLYVRESRRIMGDYVLTADDVMSGRRFDDAVACGAYCIDIHNPVGSGTTVKHLAPGVMYDIPLRCLIPAMTRNLLVADRCISGTHEALGSFRIMPIGMATGQAAGVCAALAARQGKEPRHIDFREVQQVLRRQKAVLQEQLAGTTV